MKITATVDVEGLTKRVAESVVVAEAAKRDASLAVAAAFTEAVVETTPRDTNRLVNAWIEAARDVGVTGQAPYLIKDSAHVDDYIEELESQERYFEEIVESHTSMMEHYERQDTLDPVKKDGTARAKRTRQPYYKKIKRRLRKAEKRLKRVREEIDKAAGSTGVIFFRADTVVGRKRNQQFTTVRQEFYGGEGRTDVRRGRLVVELTNKEPHGNIVEANPNHGHPVATAVEVTRHIGVTRAGHVYRRAMREDAPMGTKNPRR